MRCFCPNPSPGIHNSLLYAGDSPPCHGINHSLQLTTYFTLHSKLDTRCPCIFYIFLLFNKVEDVCVHLM